MAFLGLPWPSVASRGRRRPFAPVNALALAAEQQQQQQLVPQTAAAPWEEAQPWEEALGTAPWEEEALLAATQAKATLAKLGERLDSAAASDLKTLMAATRTVEAQAAEAEAAQRLEEEHLSHVAHVHLGQLEQRSLALRASSTPLIASDRFRSLPIASDCVWLLLVASDCFRLLPIAPPLSRARGSTTSSADCF